MTTYLLTWNPRKRQWQDLEACQRQLDVEGTLRRRWSCGVTKRIVVADRVFLLKQGVEPRGVIASGWAASDVYQAPHWDRARPHDALNYIDVLFDTLLDPDEVLPRALLDRGQLAPMHWDSQSSGISIPDSVAVALEATWADYTSQGLPGNAEGAAEEVLADTLVTEGAAHTATLTRYERDPRARAVCIAYHGYDCAVCGFNFEDRYGALGEGYIHVHHFTPLAEQEGARQVSPIRDLRPVYPNCHAMLHQGAGVLTIEELRSRLAT